MTEEATAGRSAAAGFAGEVRRLFVACKSSTRAEELLSHSEALFRLLRGKKLEFLLPFAPPSSSPRVLLHLKGEEAPPQALLCFLHKAFNSFLSLASELTRSTDLQVQKLGLSYLMRTVKLEAQIHKSAGFPLSVFQQFVSQLLQSKAFSPLLIDTFVTDYADKFVDVRYYLLIIVAKLLREFGKHKQTSGAPSRPHQTEEEEPPLTAEFESAESSAAPAAAAAAAAEDDEEEEGSNAGLPWYVWTEGEAALSARLTALMLGISRSFMRQKDSTETRGKRRKMRSGQDEAAHAESEEEKEEEDKEERPAGGGEQTFIKGLRNSKALLYSNQRLAFQNAWLLLLLEIQHSKATTQKLLSAIPKCVMPFLSNPLLLAEFFLKAFSDPRQLSLRMTALSGLFYLLTKHRLGNPEALEKARRQTDANEEEADAEAAAAGAHFYQRLYRLLTPAAFAPRLRVRFLRLLNLALRSDLLPTCLVAAFIKKCCRVACLVSPAAALCLEALAISLLQKYQATCKPLLSLPEAVAARLRVAGDGFDYCRVKIKGSNAEEGNSSSGEEAVEEGEEQDAVCTLVSRCLPKRLEFNKREIGPLVRKEAKMSLWEIELLSRHSVHAVQRLTEMFEADFSNPAAKKVCLDDFLDLSTGTLLAREIHALNKPSGAPFPAFEASAEPPDVAVLHNACMELAREEAQT
ncbi:hypothetical protein Efla_001268 [Eimeria flavescens]